MSNCCLIPTQQFFSAISWQEQVNFQWDDDDFYFVLDQHAKSDFYCASTLKQHSADRHVLSIQGFITQYFTSKT
jgi:hypothetical protein